MIFENLYTHLQNKLEADELTYNLAKLGFSQHPNMLSENQNNICCRVSNIGRVIPHYLLGTVKENVTAARESEITKLSIHYFIQVISLMAY